jgi:hypothetical protein
VERSFKLSVQQLSVSEAVEAASMSGNREDRKFWKRARGSSEEAHNAGRCVREAVARQVVSRETCTFCGVFGDNTVRMRSQSASRIAIICETKSCLLLLEEAYGLPLPTPIGQATRRGKMRRQGWWNFNHLTEYGRLEIGSTDFHSRLSASSTVVTQ